MGGSGEAGRRGSRVRSDCWVAVELRDEGGVEVDLRSKVAGMYGPSIRGQIEAGCGALGVAHAAVTIEDAGALPYVIAARFEAAVKRADPSITAEYLLDVSDRCTYATTRDRLRRSRLYLRFVGRHRSFRFHRLLKFG